MPAKDPEQRRRQQREWRAKNREKLRAYHKARYDDPVIGGQIKARIAEWKEANPWEHRTRSKATERRRYMKKMLDIYGLQPGQYDEMVEQQGGLCAICKQAPDGKSLAVDHDHSTGAIRSLLCSGCNIGLGNLQDSPELLRAAADYLEAHRSSKPKLRSITNE